jgi:hypothetical protein
LNCPRKNVEDQRVLVAKVVLSERPKRDDLGMPPSVARST